MDSSSQAVVRHHAPPQGFIRKYLFSVDHKVIGKQYYALALLAVCIGMVLSWLMRIHLGWATAHIPLLEKLSPAGAPGNVVTPEYYLSLMTMHATLMVFFVLTTAPFRSEERRVGKECRSLWSRNACKKKRSWEVMLSMTTRMRCRNGCGQSRGSASAV